MKINYLGWLHLLVKYYNFSISQNNCLKTTEVSGKNKTRTQTPRFVVVFYILFFTVTHCQVTTGIKQNEQEQLMYLFITGMSPSFPQI